MSDNEKRFSKIPLLLKPSLTSISLDKGLAKIGDGLVNLIYSVAKSQVLETVTGWKVSTEVLSRALHDSGLRDYLPNRLSPHQRANAVEAVFGYLWLSKKISIDEMILKLSKYLSPDRFTSRTAEKENAANAFTMILKEITPKLPIKKNKKK
ncbi:MAG: ribonuclease III family protein [Candidatus Ranarchaeia archaeon]